jgi:tetratricopeptide (TPR) repeat protein
MEKYGKAIEDYTEIIKHMPQHFEAHHNRGLAYQRLEEYEKAIEDYSRAIKIDPNQPQTYRNRAKAYAALDDYESALVDYGSLRLTGTGQRPMLRSTIMRAPLWIMEAL